MRAGQNTCRSATEGRPALPRGNSRRVSAAGRGEAVAPPGREIKSDRERRLNPEYLASVGTSTMPVQPRPRLMTPTRPDIGLIRALPSTPLPTSRHLLHAGVAATEQTAIPDHQNSCSHACCDSRCSRLVDVANGSAGSRCCRSIVRRIGA